MNRPGYPYISVRTLVFVSVCVLFSGQWFVTPTLPISLQSLRKSSDDIAGASPISDPMDFTYPLFAANSFWYTPIPQDVPLHPNSAKFVSEFLRQMNKFYGGVGVSTSAYSVPIYNVGRDVTPVPVAQCAGCHKSGYWDQYLAQQWASVPIPLYAEPASGTDHSMVILQPSTNAMWEFWNARKKEERWEACWGGGMMNVSKNPGIWSPRYGGAATGLPFAPGQVLVEELRRGEIRHVMGIALVESEDLKIYSWPANRSDGYDPEHLPDRIPEGLRFRLDPNVDVNALAMSPLAKIIARAAQTYGFVVWDKGGAISICFESPKTLYRGWPAKSGDCIA